MSMGADISPGLVFVQACMQARAQALGQFRIEAAGYPIDDMKTVEEIRHARLLQLIAEHRTIQALADKLGKSHSQISQLRNRVVHSTTKKPRSIGDDLARSIEEKLGKPRGWMDSLDVPGEGATQAPPARSGPSAEEWVATAREIAEIAPQARLTLPQWIAAIEFVLANFKTEPATAAEDAPRVQSEHVRKLLEMVSAQ